MTQTCISGRNRKTARRRSTTALVCAPWGAARWNRGCSGSVAPATQGSWSLGKRQAKNKTEPSGKRAANSELMARPHHLSDRSGGRSVSQKAVAGAIAAAFSVRGQMNYQAFTNDSLTMMYEAARGALAADDAAEKQGDEPRFRVRETPDWKKHAADLKREMLKRGMFFEVIDWHEGQGKLPLGD